MMKASPIFRVVPRWGPTGRAWAPHYEETLGVFCGRFRSGNLGAWNRQIHAYCWLVLVFAWCSGQWLGDDVRGWSWCFALLGVLDNGLAIICGIGPNFGL